MTELEDHILYRFDQKIHGNTSKRKVSSKQKPEKLNEQHEVSIATHSIEQYISVEKIAEMMMDCITNEEGLVEVDERDNSKEIEQLAEKLEEIADRYH